MSELELNLIVDQVLRNCDISDAEYAGLFTVCGLALRLRDLYKWENRLPPWEERDSKEILEWIDTKEQTWNSLPEKEFAPISVLDTLYDPFDTRGINALLEPRGWFYGAGYARSLKPTFFLAPIEDKQEIDGHRVYTLGRELARDLLTAPALAQDDCVVLRRQSAMFFLWDQIVYIKHSGRPALRFAMEQCGIKDGDTESLKEGLETVFAVQKETYVYHEIGELEDTVFDRSVWQEIIAVFPHTPVELLARAVKDLLADTGPFGSLEHMVHKRKAPSLAFYAAFLDGLPREFFPQLRPSFKAFMETGRWEIVQQAIRQGYSDAERRAQTMMDLFLAGKEKGNLEKTKQEMERRLLCDTKGIVRPGT